MKEKKKIRQEQEKKEMELEWKHKNNLVVNTPTECSTSAAQDIQRR